MPGANRRHRKLAPRPRTRPRRSLTRNRVPREDTPRVVAAGIRSRNTPRGVVIREELRKGTSSTASSLLRPFFAFSREIAVGSSRGSPTSGILSTIIDFSAQCHPAILVL